MALPAVLLGQFVAAPILPQLLRFAYEKGVPFVEEVLSDPSGYASRVGDLIVWNGSKGQQVIAGLQSLGESQQRIEHAVNAIEASQLATQTALDSLQLVSFASFGLTSLVGAAMWWRFEALNKRFDQLSRTISDLEDNLDAQYKAYLRKAIQNLKEFDNKGCTRALSTAKNDAQYAANLYGQLVNNESHASKPRLEVLNYRGRCYVLSLITELRCRLLKDEPDQATNRYAEEKDTITSLAQAVFNVVIGENPSAFLSKEMKAEGATLELLTEVYQSAQRFGVFRDATIQTPSDMFEYCRAKGPASRSLLNWSSKQEVQALSRKLRFLISCFEDLGRAESLALLAGEVHEKKVSFESLQRQLRGWSNDAAKHHASSSVYAYSFA